MTHSKMFDKIKKYYDNHFWNIDMVRNAVVNNKITSAEFTEITGEAY